MADLVAFVYWRLRKLDDALRVTRRARASNRGERVVMPGRLEDDLGSTSFNDLAHYQRYMYAADQAAARAPRVIVDYGCGTGYGTAYLARQFPDAEVVGFDVSKDAVGYAREHHREDNLRYTTDASELPAKADLIVSFDVIEHVPDPRAFALRLADLAAPGAICLVSGPNRLVSRDDNPHHMHEPAPADLAGWMAGFDDVAVLGQDIHQGGRRLGRDWQHVGAVHADELVIVDENVDQAYGLLAVATKATVEERPRGVRLKVDAPRRAS